MFDNHCHDQGCTTCGLSSLANFIKILSSKRVCLFRDIRDKMLQIKVFGAKQLFLAFLQKKTLFADVFCCPQSLKPLNQKTTQKMKKKMKKTLISC